MKLLVADLLMNRKNETMEMNIQFPKFVSMHESVTHIHLLCQTYCQNISDAVIIKYATYLL